MRKGVFLALAVIATAAFCVGCVGRGQGFHMGHGGCDGGAYVGDHGHGHQHNRIDNVTYGHHNHAECVSPDGHQGPCTVHPSRRRPPVDEHSHQYDYGCGHDYSAHQH